jgi:acetyl esterase/lipase
MTTKHSSTYRWTASVVLFILFSTVSLAQLSETAAWSVDLASRYRVVPNITYSVANNFECKLDVYATRNASVPVPTVIFIHGGGWVVENKESSMLSFLPYLEMGFAVVNVEYRLAKVSLAPAAVEDCRLALRWVFLNAKTYGFDTTKVIVTGGSAGGHLALTTGMLTSAAGFDNVPDWDTFGGQPKVAAIVNWFGITDVNDLFAGPNMQKYALSWFGSLPNRDELAKRLSPIHMVRKDLPPIFTVHGDRDQLVPYTHAVRLHEALNKAGVPNEFITIPGGRHGGFSREDMLRIFSGIKAFLQQHRITQ